MTVAHSKLTAQGQVSIPAAVRRKLGIGPGAVVEWSEQGDQIVVRRSGKYSWADVRRRLFPKGFPKDRTLAELQGAIAQDIRSRHSRR
jgi:AbrB family looped-hinge helix DNA binding protein